MPLLIPNPYNVTASMAYELALLRRVLPTWMGTAELRDLQQGIRERSVFSARTTNAIYLDALKQRIQRFLADGYDGDMAKLRLELKDILARLQYDPVTGFPGDAELGIPPARAGSLQDLSSDRRINLILTTQLQLMGGKGQEQQGLSAAALDLFPAYELIRVESRRVPREWHKDWATAADNVDWEGVSKEAFQEGRFVALKTSPVWPAIGSSALFHDALDVSHPPFRFGSGMGWKVVDRDAAQKWGLNVTQEKTARVPQGVQKLPPDSVSTNGLSRATLDRLKTVMTNAEAKNGRLTLESIFGNAPPPPPRKQRVNASALCDGLDCLLLVDGARVNARKKIKGGRYMTAPAKRCGSSWIAGWKKCKHGMPAQGPKGASRISQEGTAESLHLPDLRDHEALPKPAKISAEDAMKEIAAGIALQDPLKRTVHFGRVVADHFKLKVAAGDTHRAAYLPQAKEAVQHPLEVWEHQHRHRYITSFTAGDGSKAFMVASSRYNEHENLVVTFHPIEWRKLEAWRKGTLLYTAY